MGNLKVKMRIAAWLMSNLTVGREYVTIQYIQDIGDLIYGRWGKSGI